MATARQKIIIRKTKHKDNKKRPILIKKTSSHISVSKTKEGLVTIKKYNYKGELIYSNTYKEGGTD